MGEGFRSVDGTDIELCDLATEIGFFNSEEPFVADDDAVPA